MFSRKPIPKVARLERRVLSLEAEIAKRDRAIAVMQCEIDSMAGVIARDRQRVAAESAIAARQRADAEGTDEFDSTGNGRFSTQLSRS